MVTCATVQALSCRLERFEQGLDVDLIVFRLFATVADQRWVDRLDVSSMREYLETGEVSALPPSRPTVLLVEDDRAIRYLFTQVLHNSGYFVIAAEDGATGLDIARARIHTLDAVITDSRMPGLEGRELVTHIRSLRTDIPILVVSGGVEAGHGANPADPGTRYFAKPVSPERLLVELRRSLRNSSR